MVPRGYCEPKYVSMCVFVCMYIIILFFPALFFDETCAP